MTLKQFFELFRKHRFDMMVVGFSLYLFIIVLGDILFGGASVPPDGTFQPPVRGKNGSGSECTVVDGIPICDGN